MLVENLIEILTKRRTWKFYNSLDVYYLTNAAGELISQITMWNMVNQLGKHDFSCVSVVNNVKDSKFFSSNE